MTKDEIKNRISLALKDPILQQGFEIICKDLAISEHDREHNDYELTEVYKKVAELEKENTELKETLSQTIENVEFTRGLVAQRNDLLNKICKNRRKAIDIIKKLLIYIPKENIEGIYEIVEEAEEFVRTKTLMLEETSNDESKEEMSTELKESEVEK